MINRVKSFATITLLTCTLLLGCNQTSDSATGPQTFNTTYGAIEFTFPAGWFPNPDQHPYDLQCFSNNEQMNTGVFVFKQVDLAATTTPHDILQRQVADMQSKRENFKVLEAEQRYQRDDRNLTSVVYAGEKKLSRYIYRFTLIEFANDPSQFAVVLQVAVPGRWEKGKPILNGITLSARSLNQP